MDDLQKRYYEMPLVGDEASDTAARRSWLKTALAFIGATSLALLAHSGVRAALGMKIGHADPMGAAQSGRWALADPRRDRSALNLMADEPTEEEEDLEEAAALALKQARRGCKNLVTLNLDKAALGDAGAKALARMLPSCKHLETLVLSGNKIGDAGVQAIAHALAQSGEQQLRCLYLDGNEIGDTGALALAGGLGGCKHVELLNVERNRIGDPGAEALASTLPQSWNKIRLHFDGNPIGAVAMRKLVNLDVPSLTEFDPRTLKSSTPPADIGTHTSVTAMKGPYTWSKFEFDPLTRYNEGSPVNGVRIIDMLERAAKMNPDKIVFRTPVQDKDGNLVAAPFSFMNEFKHLYTSMTWKEYRDAVMDAAAAFVALGLQPMDAVNIRGVNSAEWFITFLGCIAAGGLPVGLYPTDSAEALKFKAKDSGATFIVLGKMKDLPTYAELLDDLSSVKAVVLWPMNRQYPDTVKPDLALKFDRGSCRLLMWDGFIDLGQTSSAYIKDTVKRRIAVQKPGQAGCVVYTSGTTGDPKGVLLSQDALTWSANALATQALTQIPVDKTHRIVSYLPLNHVAGQMLDIMGSLQLSREEGLCSTIFFPAGCFLKKTCFKEQLKDAQPTILLGVPEVWEGLKLKIEAATRSGIAKLVRRWIPSAIMKGVGLGSLMVGASGAGPISKSTLEFFSEMGLGLLNMYGQSESTALGSMWVNEDYKDFDPEEKWGSIGRPVGGYKLRITNPDEEGKGEIELWGRNIMLGYLNRKDDTKKALTQDGWLKTGDVGIEDKDHFVFLTGRLKEIMKDKGGEIIAPVAVEEGIKKSCNQPGRRLIKEAIVVGDGKYYISVLLTLMEEVDDGIPTGALAGPAKEVDPAAKTVAEARASQAWMETLTGCITNYNRGAAKAQQRVYRYLILPKEITPIDSPDLITPTFKIKRAGVSAKYASEIATCGGEERLSVLAVKPCGAA